MATVDPAPASIGPRYAPDDPTLPKPWKGLIDGSTGLLYYWNPETNITQYERPATLPPPLPPGPPPAASTPKLAPIPMPRTLQPNGMLHQQGQQSAQFTQQHGQQVMTPSMMQQVQTTYHQGAQVVHATPQQLGAQATQAGQQQDLHIGQAVEQHGQLMAQQQIRQQMLQQPTEPILLHPGQPMPQQQGQQMQIQQGHQTPQHQGEQMPHPQGQQYLHHQWHQVSYQQNHYPQGQQMSSQKVQHIVHQQGQQFPHHQGNKLSFPQEESDVQPQPGKQNVFSPSQIQHMGAPSLPNLPTAATNSIQIPHVGVHSVHTQQFSGPSVNMQQNSSSLIQLQQAGIDSLHRQQTGGPGPIHMNPMGPARMQNQQAVVPSTGLNMGYEEDLHGRVRNELYSHHKEGPAMGPENQKFSAIPITHNPQEMRMGGLPPQNITPGHAVGLNVGSEHAVTNIYNHVVGGPAISNNATMRMAPRLFSSSDVANLTPAEIYCQQNEVTATGDNVPAPYMTFEAAGFPLEILREMRYLLQKRSICRTLHCYTHRRALQLVCPLEAAKYIVGAFAG